MPPKRNVAVPNAVKLFNCNICDKGYPRQVDYENHLRSYDHNHRQRLAEMKKLTAANDTESNRPNKGPLDMRNITAEDSNKKPGLGPRFTKIGGGGAATGAAGGRFKKVGVAVSGSGASYTDAAKGAEEPAKDAPATVPVETQTSETTKVDAMPQETEPKPSNVEAAIENQVETRQNEDVVMDESDEEEVITWEEYDFTKPTSCDHANCPGCKTDGIWEDSWVVIGSA